ncbi:MAG: hypothetical protein COV07_01990 [Candidatus Vogelbacteria bacterium CG10_big_fil_rev_8_21_14_0_10_45_14]|uniref:Uncharacterized protein n=1 Tax=Candidatus Vogelbacteria bacterium CG10_big_fil_rev_8_21_14_0_10_45_14 TaxID=1975042 RepID=A0A2H0RJY1_9BACT|nr:MAG: hypothetical protein COV07_01990 [Candidatus Vogelbacteria bacterium CG10_big_fil_rev_8_21_14_0_10_45_14]
MANNQEDSVLINVSELNFHDVLKDIENMYWFFILSVRTLSDYDVQNILRTKNSTQEGYLTFNHMLDKFNKATDLHIEKTGNVATSKLNILKEMVFMGKAMAILTYDFLSLSSYNANINQDKEFQFLRHIRNGAAHNNRFNLKDEKGEWKIEENEIVKWNGMEISRKLQGSTVFNDFISLFSVFLLAKHFSERLIKIDAKQK